MNLTWAMNKSPSDILDDDVHRLAFCYFSGVYKKVLFYIDAI